MKTASEILCDLISIRTDPEMRANDAIVGYITAILREHDASFQLLPTGNCNNILAGVNVPHLNDIEGGIVLSGHMDTIGAVYQNGQVNPFQGIEINRKIFGRGAMDMKYFIAAILFLLPRFKQISMPILLAFSCDEETNVFGIREIIQFFQENNVHPRYALVGEATNFKLAVAHRGYIGFQTRVQGVSGHGGQPEAGVNAIYIASKIISKIEDINRIYTQRGISLNVGKIQGGNERNSIPDEVVFDWEIRYKDEASSREITDIMNRFYRELTWTYSQAQIFTAVKETIPAFEQKDESILSQMAEDILKTEKFVYPYASEAGFFQTTGIDTLICGAGDYKLAHTANECIEVADIEKYVMFLTTLIEQLPRK